MNSKLKITFYGGAGSVTGANFLLEEILPDSNGLKILFDCGLVQGGKLCESINCDDFPYKPSEIDYLIISHAHLDHIGRIPKLVREGFKGKILSTPPTKEISEIMLIDSMGILGKEAKANNQVPLYNEYDVARSMNFWDEGIPYHTEFVLGNFKLRFLDAGHILGSAMTEIIYNSKKIVYTGDLGNSPNVLLNDTEVISDADARQRRRGGHERLAGRQPRSRGEPVHGDRRERGQRRRGPVLRDRVHAPPLTVGASRARDTMDGARPPADRGGTARGWKRWTATRKPPRIHWEAWRYESCLRGGSPP